jgi:hypothetical protein
MIWFMTYGILTVALFLTGRTLLGLGWFWNACYSLLAACGFVFAAYRIIGARLCVWRVKRCIDKQKSDAISGIVAQAFGDEPRPTQSDPADAWLAGLFMYIPFVIVFVVRSIQVTPLSLLWRSILLSFVAAGFAAWGTGILANKLAAQKSAMQKLRSFLKDRSPETWDRIQAEWTIKQDARRQEEKRKYEEKEQKREEKEQLKQFQAAMHEAFLADGVHAMDHRFSHKWLDAWCASCWKTLPHTGDETYLKPDGTLYVICKKCGNPNAVLKLKCSACFNPSKSMFHLCKPCNTPASCYYESNTSEPRCDEHRNWKHGNSSAANHESLIQGI